MPITQAAVQELMQESRAAVQNNLELRRALSEYLTAAKERYYSNSDLQEVLSAAIGLIRMHPQPDDRVTYRNEWHYRRMSKTNEKHRLRQELKRRQGGVLTQPESMERLALLNAARRSGDLPSETYEQFNSQSQPTKSKGIILPRNDPDDAPLEFDLPPGATLDLGGPKLLDENNLLTGVDIAAELPDDSES